VDTVDMDTIYSDGTYLARNPQWHEDDSPYKVRLVRNLIERNGLAFQTCAEIGCGAGAIMDGLAAAFPACRFTGYDVSSDASVFWQKRNAPNLEFVRADFLADSSRYDLALCLDVFEHVDDYLGFLRALRRKADRFVFKIPLDLSLIKLVTRGIRYAREESGHLHYFNHYTALETLKYAGYEILDSRLDGSFLSVPPRNFRQWIGLAPRLLASVAGPRLASTVVGGYTLMVLAK
jgi:hypothetical protein